MSSASLQYQEVLAALERIGWARHRFHGDRAATSAAARILSGAHLYPSAGRIEFDPATAAEIIGHRHLST